MISRLPWRSILNWVLIVFFVFGGAGNIIAPPAVLTDYQRWGYPGWFHYLTGMFEVTAAMLLIFSGTRLAGVGLGCALMIAAAVTVALHGEYAHAIAPLIVFVLMCLNGWLTFRAHHRLGLEASSD